MTSPPSDKIRVRRRPERGRYERAGIDAILDAGYICHVGYVIDGAPYVTPTLYWREGDHVYWHGSSASRMLRKVDGAAVCLTVSHIDGLVLARSGFHHSANYRSAMLFGAAHAVTDPDVKRARLDNFIDRMFPGRAKTLRPATTQELKGTALLHMKIDEASGKIRTGPPKDEEEDYALPIWSGVVPLRTSAGAPQPCPRLAQGVELPAYLDEWLKG